MRTLEALATKLKMPERELIQQTYIRICRDSLFRMEAAQAAHFVAGLLKISAIDVWIALGTDNMERIAAGEHPCLSLDQYKAAQP